MDDHPMESTSSRGTMPANTMPTRAPMKRPTATELVQMICGPRVDIYVGQERKHYSVPKNLLCYFSPYFDRCFNGPFIEAREQKVELVEDTVEDFECLYEVLLSGTIIAQSGPEGNDKTLSACLDFLRYADKYQLGDVSGVIYGPLRLVVSAVVSRPRETHNYVYPLVSPPLDRPPTLQRPNGFTFRDIELVFATCPAGSPVRTLITHAVSVCQRMKTRGEVEGLQELADRLPSFAAELCFVHSQISKVNAYEVSFPVIRRP